MKIEKDYEELLKLFNKNKVKDELIKNKRISKRREDLVDLNILLFVRNKKIAPR